MAVISFESATLDWYRAREECALFTSWNELKLQLLEHFRSAKQNSMCGQFLTIKQEAIVEEYHNRFDRLVALLPQFSNEVLENTFLNGDSAD